MSIWLGVPKPGCFKPGCLQFLRGSALLCSFAPFCARLRSFADLRLCAFALICALLRAFACFCVRPRLERPRLGTADLDEHLDVEFIFVMVLRGPFRERKKHHNHNEFHV